MSSPTLTAVTDSLPSDVPKLSSDGMNWGIFEIWFSAAVKSKGRWLHFTGAAKRPDDSKDAPGDSLSEWEKAESAAHNLLLQWIPDSAVIKLQCFTTVAEAWATLTYEYTHKGAFAQTQLCTNFLLMKCPDKGDVRAFLDSLRVKKERLASIVVVIDPLPWQQFPVVVTMLVSLTTRPYEVTSITSLGEYIFSHVWTCSEYYFVSIWLWYPYRTAQGEPGTQGVAVRVYFI